MKKNKDVLAYIPGLSCQWIYRVTVQGPTVADSYGEMNELLRDVFGAFEGFVHPVAVKYVLVDYPEGTEISGLPYSDFLRNHRRSYPVDSTITDRLSPDDLLAEMGSVPVDSGERTLKSMETDRAETMVRLKDGDRFIDQDDERYVVWTQDEVTDARPNSEPIELVIRLMARSGKNPPWWELVVRTATDIWFEESEIGAVNRRRLADRLTRLAERIDPGDLAYYSEEFNEMELQSRDFDELLPDRW